MEVDMQDLTIADIERELRRGHHVVLCAYTQAVTGPKGRERMDAGRDITGAEHPYFLQLQRIAATKETGETFPVAVFPSNVEITPELRLACIDQAQETLILLIDEAEESREGEKVRRREEERLSVPPTLVLRNLTEVFSAATSFDDIKKPVAEIPNIDYASIIGARDPTLINNPLVQTLKKAAQGKNAGFQKAVQNASIAWRLHQARKIPPKTSSKSVEWSNDLRQTTPMREDAVMTALMLENIVATSPLNTQYLILRSQARTLEEQYENLAANAPLTVEVLKKKLAVLKKVNKVLHDPAIKREQRDKLYSHQQRLKEEIRTEVSFVQDLQREVPEMKARLLRHLQYVPAKALDQVVEPKDLFQLIYRRQKQQLRELALRSKNAPTPQERGRARSTLEGKYADRIPEEQELVYAPLLETILQENSALLAGKVAEAQLARAKEMNPLFAKYVRNVLEQRKNPKSDEARVAAIAAHIAKGLPYQGQLRFVDLYDSERLHQCFTWAKTTAEVDWIVLFVETYHEKLIEGKLVETKRKESVDCVRFQNHPPVIAKTETDDEYQGTDIKSRAFKLFLDYYVNPQLENAFLQAHQVVGASYDLWKKAVKDCQLHNARGVRDSSVRLASLVFGAETVRERKDLPVFASLNGLTHYTSPLDRRHDASRIRSATQTILAHKGNGLRPVTLLNALNEIYRAALG